jgi:hypothetical protein
VALAEVIGVTPVPLEWASSVQVALLRYRRRRSARPSISNIHPIMLEPARRKLFFVKGTDTYPNRVLHILRETRAQRRR